MNPMTRRHLDPPGCALLGVAAFAAQADEGALYRPQAQGSAFAAPTTPATTNSTCRSAAPA